MALIDQEIINLMTLAASVICLRHRETWWWHDVTYDLAFVLVDAAVYMSASVTLQVVLFRRRRFRCRFNPFQLTLYNTKVITIMPHRIIWSWYTGRWWVGCCIWYSDEGTGRGRSPPRPLLAVPNVTAHPSTASVPITVLLYNGSLLYGFNVHIKRLTLKHFDLVVGEIASITAYSERCSVCYEPNRYRCSRLVRRDVTT